MFLLIILQYVHVDGLVVVGLLMKMPVLKLTIMNKL